MASPTTIVGTRMHDKISTQLNVALDKPRIWHMGTIEGAEAQAYAEQWIARENQLEHDDVADEKSRQIATSPTYNGGRTRSLHDLQTDGGQQFHIHLPNTAAGTTVDASKLKEAASHRFLVVVTGKTPGLFEWADAKGPLRVENDENISVATGTVADTGYRVTIPPYSIYAIELMGGIHHFHNIRGFSFHRENMPTTGQGDDLTLNTQQWRGDLPKTFETLEPSLIYPNIDAHAGAKNNGILVGEPKTFHDADGLKTFLERTEETLTKAAHNMDTTIYGDEARSPYMLAMDVDKLARHCANPPDTFAQLVTQTFGAGQTGLGQTTGAARS
jgi:hypothetical protein